MKNKLISAIECERESRAIVRRSFFGSRKSLHNREMHVVYACEIIRKRWQVRPKEFQAKHVRWFFEVHLKDRASGTRYRYYRYLRHVLIGINKWDSLEPFLTGPWQRP